MAADRGAARRLDTTARVPKKADAPRAAPKPASLDRLIHDRTRLAIVSALAAEAAMSFNDLKAATETSDGNLSVHARKLEDAGYVTCTKSFAGRVPRTEFALTQAGHKALKKYLDHMESLIEHARRGW